jgi:hypothetical protein
VAALVLVQQPTEHRWRVKVGPGERVLAEEPEVEVQMPFLPAHKVDAPIDSHKGTGVHVANHSIVLNWEVSSRLSTTGASWMSGRALRSHFR